MHILQSGNAVWERIRDEWKQKNERTTIQTVNEWSKLFTLLLKCVVDALPCPAGWLSHVSYSNICYYDPAIISNWSAAYEYCTSLQATLPIFYTMSEYASYSTLMVDTA